MRYRLAFPRLRAPRRTEPSRLDHALIAAVTACALVMAATMATGLLAPLDRALSDGWYGTSPSRPSGRVVIVDIARAALEQGDGLRLPRARLADLLARLGDAGARRVLIDLSLSGPTTPADDARLEQALAAMPADAVAVTASAVATADHAGSTSWRRTGVLERFARRAAVVASDLAFDRDGTLRRFGIDGTTLPALPSAARWLAGAGGDTTTRIDFGIDVRRIPVIDAVALLGGHVEAGDLAGRGILVANYAAALGNGIRVPRFGALPRPDIDALSAETLLRDHPMRSRDGLACAGAILLASILATLWLARMGPWVGGASVLGLAVCALLAAAAAQTGYGLILPVANLVAAMGCGFLAAQAARHPALQRLRDAVAGLFGKGDLRLARVLDETGDALVTFTPEGRVLSMNVAARDLFMHASGEKGTSIGDLLGTQADALLSATHLSRPGHLEATIERDAHDRRHLDLKVNTMRSDTGDWIGVASIRDVTAHRAQLDLLRRMAREDPLTGLVNRLGFEQALAEGARQGSTDDGCGQMMVLMCDLDGFKAVNDRLGHQAGDALLQVIARRLVDAVPAGTVARLGGDEFGVVVRAPSIAMAEAEATAGRIAAAVARAITVEGQEVRVGVSVGIALYPGAGVTPDALVRAADAAMYRAKRAGVGIATARQQAA